MDWLWSNALGGVRLFVKDSDASAAEELLNQSFQDSFEVEGQEPFTQPRCPVCNSFDVSYKGLHKRIAYASLWLGVPIPLSRLGWRCSSCGHMWEDPDDVAAEQQDER
jgi:transposase-like protein